MSTMLPSDLADQEGDVAAARLGLGHAARLRGAFDEAATWFRAATADGGVSAWNNLGAALAAGQHADKALEAWRQGLERHPADPLLSRNLALALGEAGSATAGIAVMEPALRAHPNDVTLHLALCRLLFQADEPRPAVEALQRAIVLDSVLVRREFPAGGKLRLAIDLGQEAPERAIKTPTEDELDRWKEVIRVAEEHTEDILKRDLADDPANQETYLKLARLYQSSGRDQLAIETLQALLAIAPDHPIARHKIEVLTGVLKEPRVPDGFVSQLFDRFAETFDKVLAGLQYQAPTLALDIVQRLAPFGVPAPALELGCGTGLCGLLLRPHVSRLVGVDISPGMLAKARDRAVYDTLVEAEITAFLARTDERFPTIVSSDVLCYFGRLEPVFAGVARVLEPGGRFVCTLERMADEESDQDVLIRPHGRYSHREAHVRASLVAAGLAVVAIERQRLRYEGGDPVEGLLVLARGPDLDGKDDNARSNA